MVEIETEDSTVGVATGSGRAPAAWLIRHYFSRFLDGEDGLRRNFESSPRAALRRPGGSAPEERTLLRGQFDQDQGTYGRVLRPIG